MDFVNTLLVTLSQPKGMWQSILSGFKNGVGTYVGAVILIALIIRIVFSVVDIINKKVSMKTSAINEKMRPEIEAIQKKYGNDQRVVQQKINEVYKKYQFNMLGSCLPMLIVMALQMTVFLTLWTGLQSVANFNVAEKYENMKIVYTNVISINDEDLTSDVGYVDGNTLTIEIDKENQKMILKNEDSNLTKEYNYQTNFDNETIFTLLGTYVKEYEDFELEDGTVVNAPVFAQKTWTEALIELAEKEAQKTYREGQESFLWIKNVYRPDATASPMFTKAEAKKYLSSFYSKEEKSEEKKFDYEGKIFDCVISDNSEFDAIRKEKNGYYLLTIIAVLSSFFATWLSSRLMKNKNAQGQPGQGKFMYIFMPLILGVFTLSYTSLFAIYIIVGQLAMIAITPLTTLIVKKWLKKDEQKVKEKNVIDVDYRRKDI